MYSYYTEHMFVIQSKKSIIIQFSSAFFSDLKASPGHCCFELQPERKGYPILGPKKHAAAEIYQYAGLKE